MAEKMLYVMAQYDKKTDKELRRVQNALYEAGFIGRQTPDLPAHITLGIFTPTKEVKLKRKLAEVCEVTERIRISLSNIGLFGLDVLFIAPNVTHELLNLRGSFDDGLEWTPHTTMLIDDSEVIKRAVPVVAANFVPFAGYIESVSLYEFWPARFITEHKLNYSYPTQEPPREKTNPDTAG